MSILRTILILALLIALLPSCKPSVDLSVDVTKEWDGHAWGTTQKQLISKLKLQDADKKTEGDFTYVKTGQIRKLGEAAMGVDYIFSNNKFAGVNLASRPHAGIDAARGALTQWLGKELKKDQWRKGPIHAHLRQAGGMFVVTILHSQYASDLKLQADLERTEDLFKKLEKIKSQ